MIDEYVDPGLRLERDRMATARRMDAAVERWHRSDSDAELHAWLGLTWEQYAAWVERDELPDGYELPARARSAPAEGAGK